MAFSSFARDEPDWMLTLFIIPFVLVGIALLAYLIRQVMITTGVGPTRVEISAHPLSPGEPYDLFLSQAGRLTMNWLEVWLACDEKATYRQGTDTRTETRRVYEDRCFVRTDFEIHQGLPFESRCQVRVPEDRDALVPGQPQRSELEAGRQRQRHRLARLSARVSNRRQSRRQRPTRMSAPRIQTFAR